MCYKYKTVDYNWCYIIVALFLDFNSDKNHVYITSNLYNIFP